jgi:hypothetical protein
MLRKTASRPSIHGVGLGNAKSLSQPPNLFYIPHFQPAPLGNTLPLSPIRCDNLMPNRTWEEILSSKSDFWLRRADLACCNPRSWLGRPCGALLDRFGPTGNVLLCDSSESSMSLHLTSLKSRRVAKLCGTRSRSRAAGG